MKNIDKKTLEKIIAHAKKEYPKEACGILIQENCGKPIKICPMTNVSEEPEKNYLFDSKEQLLLFKELNFDESKIIAIYHSHIDSKAYPSLKDMEFANYDALYLIISLQDFNKPVIGVYRITNNKNIKIFKYPKY